MQYWSQLSCCRGFLPVWQEKKLIVHNIHFLKQKWSQIQEWRLKKRVLIQYLHFSKKCILFPHTGYVKKLQYTKQQLSFFISRLIEVRLPDNIRSLVFAVIGQAHADANISASTESKLLSDWLTSWAFLKSENRNRKESREIIHEIKNLIND